MEDYAKLDEFLRKLMFNCIYDTKRVVVYAHKTFNIIINIYNHKMPNMYIDFNGANINDEVGKFYTIPDLIEYVSLHPLFKMEKFPPQNV